MHFLYENMSQGKRIHNKGAGDESLPPQAYEKLIEDMANVRVAFQMVGGDKIWFKRYDLNVRNWAQRLHSLFSRVFNNPIFYASSPMSPQEALKHEVGKIEQFGAKGFNVPKVLYEGEIVLAISDLGDNLEIVFKKNSEQDRDYCDKLLCLWAGEIGKLHAAGLCHGRPHPRDVTYTNENWAFLDFEENPESVMPMEYAQARDFFLLFHQLVKLMGNKKILDEALKMYKKNAPAEVLVVAQKSLRDLGWVIKLAGLLVKISKRNDLERFLLASHFLKQNLETS